MNIKLLAFPLLSIILFILYRIRCSIFRDRILSSLILENSQDREYFISAYQILVPCASKYLNFVNRRILSLAVVINLILAIISIINGYILTSILILATIYICYLIAPIISRKYEKNQKIADILYSLYMIENLRHEGFHELDDKRNVYDSENIPKELFYNVLDKIVNKV